MNRRHRLVKVVGIAVALLIIVGCAAPFKIMPAFEKEKGQIKTIALYPLHFSQDGKEQRIFGMTFSSIFPDRLKAINYTQPIQFIHPDSTVAMLEESGVIVKNTVFGVLNKSDLSTEFPVYRPLTFDDLKVISNRVDGVIYFDLKDYNEVGAGEELGQALATACLTMGMASASENNRVSMSIALLSTKIDSVLWTYTPYFSKSMSGRESTRSGFSTDICNGFNKYFPLSAGFQQQ